MLDPAIRAQRGLADRRVLDRQLVQFRHHRATLRGAGRGHRFQIGEGHRIHAGLDRAGHRLGAGEEAFRPGARLGVHVPVERLVHRDALRDIEPERLDVGHREHEARQLLLAVRNAEFMRLLQDVHQIGAGAADGDVIGARCLGLQQERREIAGIVERVRDTAHHLAARGLDDAGGVRLQPVAERVVGDDEEPFGARLGQRRGNAAGLAVGVPHPHHAGLGRAILVGEARGAAREQGDLALLGHQMLDRDLHRGLHDVGHGIDVLHIHPFAHDGGCQFGIVAMVGGEDLDVHALARAGQAILGGHLGGDDRALPGLRREAAGHVGDDADLHRWRGRCGGRPGRQGGGQQGAGQQGGGEQRGWLAGADGAPDRA